MIIYIYYIPIKNMFNLYLMMNLSVFDLICSDAEDKSAAVSTSYPLRDNFFCTAFASTVSSSTIKIFFSIIHNLDYAYSN